ANMSHELRTPLNAIMGFADIMQRNLFGPIGDQRYQEYTVGIRESGEHLLSLINDILDLSKIEAGQALLEEQELQPAALVADCLRLVEVRAAEADLHLQVEGLDDLPALRADRRMVKQILLNLLSNAIKFSHRGGTVTVAGAIDGTRGLSLSVSDRGIGIAAPDIPKAMANFGQVESALDRKYEGTGLGLPLVKSLVELHGGGLDIESELGVGTSVSVWFPPHRLGESI
ncbi:MAG TPA: HAMP domain-containing sensor histidine kinase, partial [Alphaproteobacteria bacterium]|nr:HAMP domain-containing sensor histidine kinase [Alphaproteobacteria bacterium]